jgi:DNA-binding NtrC family response regulator
VTPRSVLIVEDDEALLETTAMALGDQGHRVSVAANGAEAMASLERQAFDHVLLDLGLPDMKGLDLLETIRRRWPAIIVVVITGRIDSQTAVSAMRLGAHDFLTKPVNAYELTRVIDSR